MPPLPPPSLRDVSTSDVLSIGHGLWEISNNLKPLLPCMPPLRGDPRAVKNVDDDDDGGGGGGKKRNGRGASKRAAANKDVIGGKPPAGEGSCEPVRLLRVRAQAMVLQLQLALYRAFGALSEHTPHVHRGAANDYAHSHSHILLHYPDADRDTASRHARSDAAILLRTLRRMHQTLRDSSAAPFGAAHAGGGRGDLPIDWHPLTPRAPEYLPSWLRGTAARELAGIAGAPPGGFAAAGAGLMLGFCADGFDEGAPGAPCLASLLHDAHRVPAAMAIVECELRMLSPPARRILAAEHALAESLVRGLANGGHSAPVPTPTVACATTSVPRGISRSGIIADDGAPHLLPVSLAHADGLGDLERWVFHGMPPPLLTSLGATWPCPPHPTIPWCHVSGMWDDKDAPPPLGESAAAAHAAALRAAERAAVADGDGADGDARAQMDKPIFGNELCATQADVLRLELRLLMRRHVISSALSTRCPHLAPAEIAAMYEHQVQVMASSPSFPCAKTYLDATWHAPTIPFAPPHHPCLGATCDR